MAVLSEAYPQAVIPAKAGIQGFFWRFARWTPAFAGVTRTSMRAFELVAALGAAGGKDHV